MTQKLDPAYNFDRAPVYRDSFNHVGCWEAEKCRELWRSVLRRAIKDALSMGSAGCGRSNKAKHEARTWFRQRHQRAGSWPFVAALLKLNSTQMRRIEQIVFSEAPLSTDLLFTISMGR